MKQLAFILLSLLIFLARFWLWAVTTNTPEFRNYLHDLNLGKVIGELSNASPVLSHPIMPANTPSPASTVIP